MDAASFSQGVWSPWKALRRWMCCLAARWFGLQGRALLGGAGSGENCAPAPAAPSPRPDLVFLYRYNSDCEASQAGTVQHETLVSLPGSAAPDMPLMVGRPSAPGSLRFLFWKMGGEKKKISALDSPEFCFQVK